MENDLQNATITIEEITNKNGRYALKSGGKTYSFFEKKADGTDTAALASFRELTVQPGDTVRIAYSESKGEFQGKEVTYRNIRKFGRPTEQQTPPPATKQPVVMSDEEQTRGRIRTHIVAALLSQPDGITKTPENLHETIETWIDYTLTGKLESNAAKKMREGMEQDEINVDDIPF